MKKKSILFALAAVCLPVVLSAQQERKITLNEAIAMARVQSVDAAVALNEDDDKLNTRTKVRSTHKKIKAGDKLVLKLKASGGAALHFTPLK